MLISRGVVVSYSIIIALVEIIRPKTFKKTDVEIFDKKTGVEKKYKFYEIVKFYLFKKKDGKNLKTKHR